jgi:hypothetical protein
MLAAVKGFDWPRFIVTRFSGDDGLDLFEARLTVLRREPSFPRPRHQKINSNTDVSFTVSLNRGGDLEVASPLPDDRIGVVFPDRAGLFGSNNIQTGNPIVPIKVHVDSETCLISSKTCRSTTRAVQRAAAYRRATSSLPAMLASEILLVNHYGEVMDGTIFTPFLSLWPVGYTK